MATLVAYDGTNEEPGVKARFASEFDGKATVDVTLILATLVPGLTVERMVPLPDPGGVTAESLMMLAPVPVV